MMGYLNNIWLLLFIFMIPVGVFCRMTSMTWCLIRCVAMMFLGWLLLILAVDLYWDQRINLLPADATVQQHLDATADGASRVFTVLFGWLYAGIYIGFWFTLWAVIYWWRFERIKRITSG